MTLCHRRHESTSPHFPGLSVVSFFGFIKETAPSTLHPSFPHRSLPKQPLRRNSSLVYSTLRNRFYGEVRLGQRVEPRPFNQNQNGTDPVRGPRSGRVVPMMEVGGIRLQDVDSVSTPSRAPTRLPGSGPPVTGKSGTG